MEGDTDAVAGGELAPPAARPLDHPGNLVTEHDRKRAESERFQQAVGEV
jgi:hypothetical protein